MRAILLSSVAAVFAASSAFAQGTAAGGTGTGAAGTVRGTGDVSITTGDVRGVKNPATSRVPVYGGAEAGANANATDRITTGNTSVTRGTSAAATTSGTVTTGTAATTGTTVSGSERTTGMKAGPTARAATGPQNPALKSPQENSANEPVPGANSFTEGEARAHIAARGYDRISNLTLDANGIWRGTARKDGKSGPVSLDYQGNVH